MLSRSSFTWCQCWSSSRLPRERSSCPSEDELTPAKRKETGRRERDGGGENVKNNQFCCQNSSFDSTAMPSADVEILVCALPLIFFFSFRGVLPHKNFKVNILCVLLHNAFLTRTNMLEEISLKGLLFLAAGKPKGRLMFNL